MFSTYDNMYPEEQWLDVETVTGGNEVFSKVEINQGDNDGHCSLFMWVHLGFPVKADVYKIIVFFVATF